MIAALPDVPHARDVLISFLDLEAFKRFTFWSEHLMPHTRLSLETLLRATGSADVKIGGGSALSPGQSPLLAGERAARGHQQCPTLRDPDLESAHGAMLERLDPTDTLIATASR